MFSIPTESSATPGHRKQGFWPGDFVMEPCALGFDPLMQNHHALRASHGWHCNLGNLAGWGILARLLAVRTHAYEAQVEHPRPGPKDSRIMHMRMQRNAVYTPSNAMLRAYLYQQRKKTKKIEDSNLKL